MAPVANRTAQIAVRLPESDRLVLDRTRDVYLWFCSEQRHRIWWRTLRHDIGDPDGTATAASSMEVNGRSVVGAERQAEAGDFELSMPCLTATGDPGDW